MIPFSNPPYPVAGALSPFTVNIPDNAIQTLMLLLQNCPIAPPNRENSQSHGGRLGVTRDWLIDAVAYWQKGFDWRRQEETMNSIPNFMLSTEDNEGRNYKIHFAALFSQNPDAIPILFIHGWPGSYIEYLPIMLQLREKYASDPSSLPYHIIVPSLVGFGFSSPAPMDVDFSPELNAQLLQKLMFVLGFGGGGDGTGRHGYIVQGGDLGAIIANEMSGTDAVRGIHVNLFLMEKPEGFPPPPVSERESETSITATTYTALELESLKRAQDFQRTGFGYALIQGTKPSTFGMAIGSSPVALLAWIGEKMIAWSDEPLHLDTILQNVSLWWFSQSFQTSLWCYRDLIESGNGMTSRWEKVTRPIMGVSWFPKENMAPRAWIQSTGKVIFYRVHEKGGHFPALEVPELLWQDVVDFISVVLEKH